MSDDRVMHLGVAPPIWTGPRWPSCRATRPGWRGSRDDGQPAHLASVRSSTTSRGVIDGQPVGGLLDRRRRAVGPRSQSKSGASRRAGVPAGRHDGVDPADLLVVTWSSPRPRFASTGRVGTRSLEYPLPPRSSAPGPLVDAAVALDAPIRSGSQRRATPLTPARSATTPWPRVVGWLRAASPSGADRS